SRRQPIRRSMKRRVRRTDNIHRVEAGLLQSFESIRQNPERVQDVYVAEALSEVPGDDRYFGLGIEYDHGTDPTQQRIDQQRCALASASRSDGQEMTSSRIMQRMATVRRVS